MLAGKGADQQGASAKRKGKPMNFEFSEDQKLLKDQVRKFLEDKSPSSEVRKVLDGEDIINRDVWQGICELGILGTAIPEEFGGAGAGYLELCVVAEELGRAVAPVPFSSSIYLAAEALMLAGSAAQKTEWLPSIASGEVIGTLAVSETVGNPRPETISLTAADGHLSGTKTPVADGCSANLAIVLAAEGTGTSLYLVDLNDPSVRREQVNAVDPTRPMAEISFANTPAERLGTAGLGWEILQKVYDRAAILFAFEQLGGAQAALEAGVAYAQERFAFGRQIGSFQAIKHMLADMYVDMELAKSNCYYGAWALESDAGEMAEAAATARVSATTAYQNCSKNNIQVHGGMGFTWEFDCHLHYRRSNLLALIIGSKSEWQNKLVSRLEARNRLSA